MESRQIAALTQDDSQAPLLLGLGGGILILAILLLGARLWSRLRPVSNLKADDWAALGGTILAILQFAVQCAACFHGFGRRTPFVSLANRTAGLRLVFVAQAIWYWSITLTKVSVALLLLRLKPGRRWKSFLYSMIVLVILTGVMQTCFLFLQCRPFSVYWDRSLSAKGITVKCISVTFINGNIYANSTVNITTDLIFSFIPITFIRKLHRPRREKIFISVLMGLGLFASTFSVLRTLMLQKFGEKDFYRNNVMLTLWATLELEVALIAATIPTLRSFVNKSLIQLGLYFYDQKSETQIRGRLVEFGFLPSGTDDDKEVLFWEEEKDSSKILAVGSPSEGKKAEFEDSMVSLEKDTGVVRVGNGELGKV
ncbi:hypothetical protein GQ44DRAFT_755145 [Phaeosphaeriaceae sp. PMI808]|nr:hypothetical protein GQ44DRAFT_755145 [Phaeosphaeriaceae sp. PMI808]